MVYSTYWIQTSIQLCFHGEQTRKEDLRQKYFIKEMLS